MKLQPMLDRLTELWTPLAQFGSDEQASMKKGGYYMTRVIDRSTTNGSSELYLISLNSNYMSVLHVSKFNFLMTILRTLHYCLSLFFSVLWKQCRVK